MMAKCARVVSTSRGDGRFLISISGVNWRGFIGLEYRLEPTDLLYEFGKVHFHRLACSNYISDTFAYFGFARF